MQAFQSSTNNNPLDQLVEVAAFVFATIDTWKEAKADGGGINFLDLPKAFSLIADGKKAFDGIELIPGAWKNSTDAEKLEVYEYFTDRFDLANEVVEVKVEKAVLAAGLILDIFA